jgi:hypothetical protein
MVLWITVNNRTSMSNNTIFFLVWSLFILLALRLLVAAAESANWQGAWVSIAHLGLAACCLSILLRAK